MIYCRCFYFPPQVICHTYLLIVTNHDKIVYLREFTHKCPILAFYKISRIRFQGFRLPQYLCLIAWWIGLLSVSYLIYKLPSVKLSGDFSPVFLARPRPTCTFCLLLYCQIKHFTRLVVVLKRKCPIAAVVVVTMPVNQI